MSNLFRNIRKKLASENNFQKYIRYAVGEVLLIMLGIFMALQLQNWNEGRKQDALFKVTLEQLYNTIHDDADHFNQSIINLTRIISSIDIFLNHPDSIQNENLPLELWLLAFDTKYDYNSETIRTLNDLVYNPNNVKQNDLSKQLLNYGALISKDSELAMDIGNSIADYLAKNYISFPYVDENNSMRGIRSDTLFYNELDYQKARALTKSREFRILLQSNRSQRVFQLLNNRMRFNDAQAMLRLIKNYYPEVKLLYQDVGIIGTSINGFDDVGARSTPMTLTNDDSSIWEITMYLKKGRVKFRCRDSWAINWGGDSFPSGKAVSFGNDINVSEAGNYHIILNLTTNTYEFIKQDD